MGPGGPIKYANKLYTQIIYIKLDTQLIHLTYAQYLYGKRQNKIDEGVKDGVSAQARTIQVLPCRGLKKMT